MCGVLVNKSDETFHTCELSILAFVLIFLILYREYWIIHKIILHELFFRKNDCTQFKLSTIMYFVIHT